MGLITITSAFVAIAALGFGYLVVLSVYRVWFHPLSSFPGPTHAGLTYWTEFYWDCIRRGEYAYKLDEWHKVYGPIIRISPEELHINDSTFYDIIYPGASANRRVDKWYQQARLFGTELSGFGTVKHELHRARRAPLAPLFSRRAVMDLQGLIKSKLDIFTAHLQQYKGTGRTVNLFAAFAALTGDIISHYAFGRSLDFLEKKDFNPSWHHLIADSARLGAIGRQFSLLWPMMNAVPKTLLHMIDPSMRNITFLKSNARRQITEVMTEMKHGCVEKPAGIQRTIFHEILESANLPPSEKSMKRMFHEANVVMAAGTATTADTLAVICFYILHEPAVQAAVRAELAHAYAHASDSPGDAVAPRWQDLERLPYLTAVIKEGLRIAPGVTARLPRVSPDRPIDCHGWRIPPAMPVSMSAWTVHFDESIFPQPRRFAPERWLTAATGCGAGVATTHELDRFIVSFSRGTRQCVGMTLAWAEMYLSLAALFGPGAPALELFETGLRDVQIVSDNFNPGFPVESKGVRVLVK